MLINIDFTDPQGMTHTGAIFMVRSANESGNTNSSMSLSTDDFATYNESINPLNFNVNFEVYYWTTQAAKDAGAAPYILVNTQSIGMNFSFQAGVEYDGLTLEAKVDKYLTDVVLPPMLTP